MEALPEKRILIYGVSGAGKTTFARHLGERTGIPWHSADELAWLPGWIQRPLDEQVATVRSLIAEDAWILDTAYESWRQLPFERVQLVIGLDYSRTFTLFRLLRRTIRRAIDKQPICNGNIESFKILFSKDSIILWHCQSFARKRRRMREWAGREGGPRVILFRHPREAERWLGSL